MTSYGLCGIIPWKLYCGFNQARDFKQSGGIMKRVQYNVSGIVQGVGIRPFISRITKELGLHGYIRNTADGVLIEVEGEESSIIKFDEILKKQHPVQAVIHDIITRQKSNIKMYSSFRILQSEIGSANTLISPDISICKDCLEDLKDETNPRFRYPFINCTNCGPRFSIMHKVPYDRYNTSMNNFGLCAYCESEYNDIDNRRYHAQPVCCEYCGPKLLAYSANGELLNPLKHKGNNDFCIAWAKDILKKGGVLTIKGLSGIHLVCSANDQHTVKRIRKIKNREEKPFAIMCKDINIARKICNISQNEEESLESEKKPIVLLEKKKKDIYNYVSDNSRLGVMLPYTPLHHLIMDEELDVLVMTSANLSGTPIIIDNQEAIDKLIKVDGLLLHDREIVTRCDDSLITLIDGQEYFFRRSRGYTPAPMKMPYISDGILACGAEQKASFGVTKNDLFFQSPFIGDMKNLDTLNIYIEQVANFGNLFGINVRAIVCDMHPDYLTTEFAIKESNKRRVIIQQVQHHFAHFASCMADNFLDEKCIGIVYDGTGYGEDGNMWGGEIFTGDYKGYYRWSSIRPISLVGGDSAIKKIERLGAALSLDAGKKCSPYMDEYNFNNIKKVLNSELTVLKASSIGRLFDAVSSIIGIVQEVSYEGQGAMLLEAIAYKNIDTYYDLQYYVEHNIKYFDTRGMVSAIYKDLENQVPTGEISAKFMNTLIHNALYICKSIRNETRLNKVCLSGGVFQNIYLLQGLTKILEEEKFIVYRHHQTSCNDEGIGLGQAMIMGAYMKQVSGGN